MDLLEELDAGPLIADGAMGTLLLERGASLGSCLEELCLSSPRMIEDIHAEYLAAGARIIETHTFGANASRLAQHNLENRVCEINWEAAQIARAAAKGRSAWVAGCVGPLWDADSGAINRRAAFEDQIGALLDGGVQLIHLETFTDLAEILLALHVKNSLHHCPVICSLVCRDDGTLPDGTSLEEAMSALVKAGADICGVNCVPVARAESVLSKLPREVALSAFPNAGHPQEENGTLVYEETPLTFAHAMAKLAAQGVRILGGCCGTTPAHVEALASALKVA